MENDPMLPTIKDPERVAEHEITLTRVLRASRPLVWAAWTEPEQIARWWGPRGLTVPLETVVVDLRPGGRYAMTMVTPSGTELPNDAVLTQVVPLERLVFAAEMREHPGLRRVETSVDFRELDAERTEVVVHQRMIAAQEMPRLAEIGWGQTLDRLEEMLAA